MLMVPVDLERIWCGVVLFECVYLWNVSWGSSYDEFVPFHVMLWDGYLFCSF